MLASKKQKTAAFLLTGLGAAIAIIGVLGQIAPPVITGLGFFVLAWALWP